MQSHSGRPSGRSVLAARAVVLTELAWRRLKAVRRGSRARLRDDLVIANHILSREGVLDAFGHVSARDAATADRFLLSCGLAPELVGAADVMEYDLDSRAPELRRREEYLERFLHGEIYRARPDVHAIVHCHTPSLIPFADSTVSLRPMYHMAAFVAEGVPVFDIRDAAGLTDMLVRDAPRARALANALGDHPAVLMRGHGAVVVGGTVAAAVGRAIYLDLNARIQAQAVALGGRVNYLDIEEARRLPPGDYERAWELWKRLATARRA
jgi:ribulose-5-phosphate 4-epimerase/fuculose-1-phosphate aldolase